MTRSKYEDSPYRSKFEHQIAEQLDERSIKYTYETYSYEYEEPLRRNLARCLDCDGKNLVRTGWYTPDFFLSTGIIIETKGRFTAADRRKMLAIKEAYPDEDIKLLFMRDNKIDKRSKTKYSDWCEANGYDYSINELKEEWLQ